MSAPALGNPATPCFHCGLPLPAGALWRARVLGGVRDFCCGGCRAVAEAISRGGLDDYYRLRTASGSTAAPSDAPRDRLFDREELQESFVTPAGAAREAWFVLERVRCAACLWLIERHLRAQPGVTAVVVLGGATARIAWDPSRARISTIRAAVREIGYEATPFDPSHRSGLEREAARRDAGRLVFSGAVGMMVMNLAIAAYVKGGPDASGRLALWETFARWSELLGATVLLAYSGQDFFAGAWRDWKRRRAGMDVPIVLGLVAAWAGSAWATARGSGPVYFDAIAMLVFFVLLARAFETRGRLRAASILDRHATVEPATARRLEADRSEREVAALDLSAGDVVRVRPGEVVPADGVLLEEEASFDESVLTGDPWPRVRRAGDAVSAGSCNRGQPALVRVTRVGRASTAGEIRRLVEKGLASRPPSALLADRLAGGLAAAVLLLAAATAAFWTVRDPAVALPAVIAVLLVTCPCALALATPIALAIAAGRLATIGVLPVRLGAIERLADADTVAFDKTGTLTLPVPVLEEVRVSGGLDRESAIAIAAALERDSGHPVAAAIRDATPRRDAADRVRHDETGVAGIVGGVGWRIGAPPARPDRLAAVLTDGRGRETLFTFAERLRPGAQEIVENLRSSGIRRAAILSGDGREPVEKLGEALGFDEACGQTTSSDKLEWIRSHTDRGESVLFVGDGLNDAPTLASAGVSVSFGEAPQLSRLSADFVILGDSLEALGAARRIARRSRRVLVQNVVWALAYNFVSVPLAAFGLLPPWVAAFGMSASSVIVVANALRLFRPAAGERLSGGSAGRV